MDRFVLLYHECPLGYVKPSHWDFMLEFDGVLRTWELRELPARWRGEKNDAREESIPATRLADHRLEYLDYEGAISNNRGSVKRVATGTFKVIDNTAEQIAVHLDSDLYRGETRLTATSQHGHWLLSLPV